MQNYVFGFFFFLFILFRFISDYFVMLHIVEDIASDDAVSLLIVLFFTYHIEHTCILYFFVFFIVCVRLTNDKQNVSKKRRFKALSKWCYVLFVKWLCSCMKAMFVVVAAILYRIYNKNIKWILPMYRHRHEKSYGEDRL